MESPYLYILPKGIQEITTHTKPSMGGGNTGEVIYCKPFDLSSIDYQALQKKYDEQLRKIVQAPLKLYWNSHTEEPFSECKEVVIGGRTISIRRRITRKKYKI